MKINIFFIAVLFLIIGCSEPEPRKPIVRKTTTFLKESIERNKQINELEEEELKRLIEQDSINDYISSENGFWFYYVKRNSSSEKLPVKGDEVLYEYKIDNIYGEPMYTIDDLGERTYIVDKQELITGLQDGLKLMKEEETVVFLFPSHKAYGYSGYQKIGRSQPLKYTVTVKKISSKN